MGFRGSRVQIPPSRFSNWKRHCPLRRWRFLHHRERRAASNDLSNSGLPVRRLGEGKSLCANARTLKMRKLKIIEHISLDGVIAPRRRDEDGEYENGGWTSPYRTPAGAAAVAEAQGTKFDLLLGRRTYDLWADYWPKVKGGPFADGLNAATKYVATHRPESLGWGPVGELGADVIDGVRRVKSKDGPDLIVWGSSTLKSVLLEQGLVDEVVLAV